MNSEHMYLTKLIKSNKHICYDFALNDVPMLCNICYVYYIILLSAKL